MASSVVEIAEHVFVVEYHCYLYHLLEATGIELTKLPNTNNGTIGFPTESIDIKLTRNGKVSHYEKIQFPKRFTDVMDFYSFELEPPVFFPCYEYHVLSKNGVVLKHVLFQTQRNNFPVLLLLPEVMLDVELNDITSIHAIFHERGHEYKMDFMDVLPSVGSFLSPPKAAITTNGKAIRTSTGIDLRPKSLRILCQGDLGTCGVSAIVGFLEFITGTELSVLFLYYVTRIFMDGAIPNNDAGVELDSCVEALSKYGICSLQAWPYDVVNFCVEPSKLAFEEASKFKPGTMLKQLHTIEDMKQALDNELAFFADINFAPRTYTKTVTRTGKVPLPASFAELDADSCEHSVLVLGYDDEARHFIFQNSWGTDWGINGFGFFHYDYITHKMFKNAFTWNGPLPGNPFTSDQQSS